MSIATRSLKHAVYLFEKVASQIVCWLLEEARTVGTKASREFLSLSLEIVEGERVSLVAHVNPEDAKGCISWWLVMENGCTEEREPGSESRKLLGHLSLDVLYSVLMDLINLCGTGRNALERL